MRAVGLIAEFNPFHRGHAYALAEAKKKSNSDVAVVVMSGNFVQRGEPAIVDKWTRAQVALQSGADLVVELPPALAAQAAPNFAKNAIGILAGLGVRDLSFGSERADVNYAKVVRKIAKNPPDPSTFKETFNETYATQLNTYYSELTGLDLSAPNLLLGMSYAQAALDLGVDMTLWPFERQGSGHDATEVEDGFASASLVRKRALAGESVEGFVPEEMAEALKANPLLDWEDFFSLLRYRLQTARLEELREIYTMSEGLEYRFTQQIEEAADFASFLNRVKSKRYTYARLRRLALYTLLNYTTKEVEEAQKSPFVHVLGFSENGRAWLNRCKKEMTLPLIAKVDSAMLAPGGALALLHRADSLITAQTGVDENFGRVPLRV